MKATIRLTLDGLKKALCMRRHMAMEGTVSAGRKAPRRPARDQGKKRKVGDERGG